MGKNLPPLSSWVVVGPTFLSLYCFCRFNNITFRWSVVLWFARGDGQFWNWLVHIVNTPFECGWDKALFLLCQLLFCFAKTSTSRKLFSVNDVIFQFKNQNFVVSENFRIAFVLNVINYSSSKIYVFGYKKLPVRTTLQKGITVNNCK